MEFLSACARIKVRIPSFSEEKEAKRLLFSCSLPMRGEPGALRNFHRARRTLEMAQVIERRFCEQHPPRAECALTKLGRGCLLVPFFIKEQGIFLF